ERILNMIRSESGKHFAPRVVEAFLQIVHPQA
ncbi:MAG TPA: HD-GYP domain-containing protein, partial [Chloroflexi bacterium]|nr:HD-GYP domain-containing protein [Chloroflexota bacterium]